jgi:RNA polymerase sigma-70 factor (ECF subfamily)
MAAADDSELLQSAREGDASAFDTLIRRHDRFLYRVARSVLLDDYEAEDVVQETFIKAFKHLGDFRGRGASIHLAYEDRAQRSDCAKEAPAEHC